MLSFITVYSLFLSLFVGYKSEGTWWLHTYCISCPFIPVTIHGNTGKDLNQRDKGLGGTAQPTESSATEIQVKNANLVMELKILIVEIHNHFLKICFYEKKYFNWILEAILWLYWFP